MKTTLLLFFLSFSLIIASQTADNQSIMIDTVDFVCDKNPAYQDSVNGLIELKEEPVYTELKSDNPTICLEKKAEYTDGVNEFRNLVANNLRNPLTDTKKGAKSKIAVRVVAEKKGKTKNAKPNDNKSNNLKEIQALEAEIIRIIYLSAGKWIPAEMNCEKVRINVAIPVNWEQITRPIKI